MKNLLLISFIFIGIAAFSQTSTIPYLTSTPDPSSRTLDLSKTVGATKWNSNISSTGAAIYSIPIYSPPGTNGMVPNLSIGYNSSAGNGILGYGWNIYGVSSVRRTGSNWFYHHESNEISLGSRDHLMIDGNELLLLNPPSGPVLTYTYHYVTRNQDFSKIDRFVTLTEDYIVVQTKNGLTKEYGRTGNSKSVVEWKINKITDQNGNYVNFNYYLVLNEIVLASIQYTGNDNKNPVQAPYNTLVFSYKDRTDKMFQYINGQKIEKTKILEKIDVKCENVIKKTYKFEYYYDDVMNNSKLYSIEELDNNGNSYNKTLVDWGEIATSSNSSYSFTTTYSGAAPKFIGDFNGDGITDIVMCEEFQTDYWRPDFYISNSTGGFTKITTSFSYAKTTEGAYIGDFDNDGVDEFTIGKHSDVDFYEYQNGSIVKYDDRSFDAAFISTLYVYKSPPNGLGFSLSPSEYIRVAARDLTGDGRNEVIYSDFYCIYKIESVNNSTLSIPLNEMDNNNDFSYIAYKNLLFSDFNGNGKSEIILETSSSNNTNYSAYEYNNATGLFVEKIIDVPEEVVDYDNYNSAVVDLNNDMKSDVIFSSLNYSSQDVYLYNGTAFVQYGITTTNMPTPQPIDPLPGVYPSRYTCNTDWNNDGLLDFIINGRLFYNKGFQGNNIILEYSTTLFLQGNVQGDFNGDGTVDNASYSTITFSPDNKKNKIVGVYDGLNNYIKYDYKTLAEDVEYTKANGTTLPNRDFEGRIYVVKDKYTPDGVGGQKHDHFVYHGAKVNVEGLGFIGFDVVTSQLHNGITRKDYYEKQILTNSGENNFFSQLNRREKILTSNNSIIEETELSFAKSFSVGGKQMFVYPLTKTVIDNLSNKKELTTYVFNTVDGNKMQMTAEIYKLSTNTLAYTLISDFTYTSILNWHVPSLVDTKTATATRVGKTPNSKNAKYIYDNLGRLQSEELYQGLAQAVTTSYSNYDACGLPQSVSISASDIQTRIENYTYDVYSRYVISTSNNLGTLSQKIYDPMYGQVLSETNIDGLTASSTYDGFGSLLSSTDYYGNTLNSVKSWVNQIPYCPHALFQVKKTKPFVGNKVEAYDVLGRAVATINSVGVPGGNSYQDVYSFIEYNSLGQVSKTSEPGVNPNPALLIWDNFLYDDYGRIISKQHHNLSATHITYTTNTITTTNTNSNIYNKKTLDVTGLVVESEDNGGSVVFDYNSQNNLISTTTNGLVTTNTYDVYGRLVSSNNPNNGSYTYAYNSVGEKTQVVTPKGDLVTNTYDQYGRLVSEICSNGDGKQYAYKTSSPGLGKLSSVVLTNGFVTNFTYNSYGDIHTYTEQLNSKTFTFTFDYDNVGKLISKTFPSGYKVDYGYDTYSGLLTSLFDNTNQKPISTIDSYYHNVTIGTPLSLVLGTNLIQNNTFNMNNTSQAYNSLEKISYSDLNSNNVLYSQSYSFDANTGNLNQRTDDVRMMTETFSYDNLNRLTEYDNPFTGKITTSYSNNGNITNSSELGDYFYDAVRKNAVIKIDANNEISNETQNTSYNYFNKVTEIQQDQKSVTFAYGFDNQRRIMKYSMANGDQKTVYYFGDYEYVETNSETKEIHYLNGVGGLDAIYVIKDNAAANEGKIYYVAKDYLGSIMALFDENNMIVDENSFDPWGRKRNPNDWSYDLSYKANMTEPDLTDRGYTGHEHLVDFQLINMNGRMYDPISKQMTSPDIIDLYPNASQSYNRYAYAFNNPFRYTDPSGYVEIGHDRYYSGSQQLGGYIRDEYDPSTWIGSLSDRLTSYLGASGIDFITVFDLVRLGAIGGAGPGAPLVDKASSDEEGLTDWNNSSDGEKIIAILNGLRDANLKGSDKFDIRSVFKNMPSDVEGGFIYLISEITINDETFTVDMGIFFNHYSLEINSFPSKNEQISAPFDNWNVNGYIKNGYWDYMEYNFYRGSLGTLRISTSHYYIDQLYKFINP